MKNEVTIAGGGLAGLSLALGLRRQGVPVVVHEAGRYPRHRVCGEFISGVSQATLEQLGVSQSLEDAKRHRQLKWFRQGRDILTSELPEPALAISRHGLDERLSQTLVELGGEVVESSRVTREPREGLVWAAGRLPCKSQWLGLKCHLLDFRMNDGLEMHLGDNGYLGLTPIEDGRVNLCGLFKVDRSLSGKGSDLLLTYLRAGGHHELADRVDDSFRDESSFMGVAGFELGWQQAEGDLCAVGDAAGMIPPFTGNGMSMAFESAEMAMPALQQWSDGQMSWSAVLGQIRQANRRKFRRRVASAMKLHQLLLHARGQDLIEAIASRGLLPFRPLLALVR